MIRLHQPWYDKREERAVLKVLRSRQLAGNGKECAALEEELAAKLKAKYAFAVSSGSHALEMAMEIAGVSGGEVILPSFTFPSVANAILRTGAKPVFCEIRETDLNLDCEKALSLVSRQTKAIVVTHYGGHPVDVRNMPVPIIEDAAHALGSKVRNRFCGTLGPVGCLSFHQTKNCASGEGGAILCNTSEAARKIQVLREKGTNREDFIRGRVKFYAWVAKGSSFVLPELLAAIVRVQLTKLDEIVSRRRRIAEWYDESFADLEQAGLLKIVRPLKKGDSCYHIYAVLVNPAHRSSILTSMRTAGIETAFHFLPLHSSPYGRKLNSRVRLPQTDRLASSIIRLPIYPGLKEQDLQKIALAFRKAIKRL